MHLLCVCLIMSGVHAYVTILLRTGHLLHALSLCLQFLDVYKPSEAEMADVGLYAKNVQALVAKYVHLDSPV